MKRPGLAAVALAVILLAVLSALIASMAAREEAAPRASAPPPSDASAPDADPTDPEGVRIEITGVTDDRAKQKIREKLWNMTSKRGMVDWEHEGTWYVWLPVSGDARAFAEKIDFGDVTDVEITIKVSANRPVE